jgi:tetratricopeptide (TPR) repeat protein
VSNRIIESIIGRALALAACGGLALAACGGTAPSTTTTPPREAPVEAAAPAVSATVARLAEGAFRFDDLGSFHREVTTKSEEAQAYFDQGLALTYGFNHDEAARSFARAAQIDPSCAMCFWGAALTLGPNYNVPMLPDRAQTAWDALQQAREASSGASDVERALIEALARRYPGPEYVEPAEMQPYTEAYAGAMREVAERFPDDDDVMTLFAEAAMNVNPWKLWSPDGEPAEGTPEIVAALERVLARSEYHPGANHYYIHAVEASREPARALGAADRLGGLLPDAGHTVHMPAHIYQRVGRYADASEANRRAIEVDRRYLARTKPPGYYEIYLSHNHGFLAYSASMEGRAEESLAASRGSAAAAPMPVVCSMPGMDFFLSEPLLVMVRFGRWDEILAEPSPAERHAALLALYRFARGVALASTGQIADAKAELEALDQLRGDIPDDLMTGLNNGREVLALAAKVLSARIAERDRRAKDAIRLYEEAVTMEDGLAYNEPADWFFPVRHMLGAALLDARRAKDAEAVYRADLERNPANGWALFGLAKSLRAQRRIKDAEAVEEQFRAAWAASDITLERTAY